MCLDKGSRNDVKKKKTRLVAERVFKSEAVRQGQGPLMENLFDDGEICHICLARCRHLQNKRRKRTKITKKKKVNNKREGSSRFVCSRGGR